MNTLSKRLESLEERKAFREFLDGRHLFAGRTQEELEFFAVHGYFPETFASEPPSRQEFTVGGIRTVITVERVRPCS
jgi:hypothetical protein